MANLNAAAPHFIRCIKPNSNKRAHDYDGVLVTKQLRYTGSYTLDRQIADVVPVSQSTLVFGAISRR